jgi:predicted AAA+ superfamily ATPase
VAHDFVCQLYRFFATPYHKNTIAKFANKEKLYFYDTGLAASLMKIRSVEHLKVNHEIRGKLFENLIFSEIWKKNFISGEYLSPASFWTVMGSDGYEVGMIIEGMTNIKAIEIKSSDKFDIRWFDNMRRHEKLQNAQKFVVYTGETMDVPGGRAINFKDVGLLLVDD